MFWSSLQYISINEYIKKSQMAKLTHPAVTCRKTRSGIITLLIEVLCEPLPMFLLCSFLSLGPADEEKKVAGK